MSSVTITTNANEVASAFVVAIPKVEARGRAIVRHHGVLLQSRVKAHAFGRPGPRAPTGDYNRSIGVEFFGNLQVAGARVGTNRDQGRRLELGFVGEDSLGRRYNQPPFPHFGPAADQTQPGFEADASALVIEVLL